MAPTDTINDLPFVLTVRDCARFLRASEFVVREAIKTGQLGHVRLGRLIRINRDELGRFLGTIEK